MKRLFLLMLFFGVSFIACTQSHPNIDSIVSKYAKPNQPGCVVLLSKNGEVIYHKAFGKASIELNVPMEVSNTFRIASMTKQFVAVATLTLVEKGLISLEDDIKKYVPDFPTGNYSIKIKNLLSHTSGIKNLTTIPGYYEYMKKVVTLSELINYFKDYPIEFAPGTQNRYSNSGYILLHYIIEKVSGKKLDDYLKTEIFAKIGVTTATLDEDNKIIANKSSGYFNENMTADWMSMTQIACLVMSAEDMYKWHIGLKEGKLISKEHLKHAQSGFEFNDGSYSDYGFGWEINVVGKDTLIQHGGGINGYGGYEVYFPKEDIFCVLLCNSQSMPEDLIVHKIISAISGNHSLLNEVPFPSKVINDYLGKYSFEEGKIIATIEKVDDKIYLKNRYPDSNWQMHFYNENQFYIEEQYPFVYTLIRDNKTGKIDHIHIKGRGEYIELAKKIK